ncbi:MAG: FecR domain-containing protein [Pseudomonadota bacterium]
MTDRDEERLTRDAADLLLRLLERPDDPALLRERARWLSAGQAEREALEAVELAWGITAPEPARRPARSPLRSAARWPLRGAVFGAVAIAAALAALLIGAPADFETGVEDQVFTLASGDTAHLDAASAVDVAIDAMARRVTLQEGAVFVDVLKDPRPFKVRAGDLRATALGTAFAVEHLEDGVAVSVAEGRVEVRRDTGAAEVLEAGERVILASNGALHREQIAVEAVGAWRNDQLVVENARLVDVATVLDRRIAGRVLIASASLTAATVTGSFDLNKPLAALRILSATQGAEVIDLSPAVVIIASDTFFGSGR